MTALRSRKRDLFVLEYLKDLNATAAAIRAGYSARTAASIGHENLRKPEIAAEIQKAMDERAKRIGMTADEVLLELKAIGMSDIRHYQFNDDGPDPLVLAENAPDIAMRAISSVKRKTRRISKEGEPRVDVEEVEFKLWDKPAALRMAGQHLKLFGDDAGGGVDPHRPIVFLLPIPALTSEDWLRGVKERKAGRPGQEIVVQPPRKLPAGKKK